jgi:hypothetical protein
MVAEGKKSKAGWDAGGTKSHRLFVARAFKLPRWDSLASPLCAEPASLFGLFGSSMDFSASTRAFVGEPAPIAMNLTIALPSGTWRGIKKTVNPLVIKNSNCTIQLMPFLLVQATSAPPPQVPIFCMHL